MEKTLLIKSLKHWCDLIWEYNSDFDRIYVHHNKLMPKITNNWYSPKELSDTLSRDYSFKITHSELEEHINSEYLQQLVQKNIERKEFQLWFYHRASELKWYNIQVEKMGTNCWLITGKDMFGEMTQRSMYKTLHTTFDCILSLDLADLDYIVIHSNDPTIPRGDARSYSQSIEAYIRRYSVNEDKERLRQELQIENVLKKLETAESYTVFLTVRNHSNGISYKRIIFSYYDDSHQRLSIARLDISSIVSRYEQQIIRIRRENSIDALTGVYSRNYYEKNLRSAVLDGYLCMIDFDDLKTCNDFYGHKAGDLALIYAVSAINHAIRPEDKLIRFGGDEFLLLLAPCPEDEFEQLLHNIQQQVTGQRIPDYPDLRLSVSIGGTRAAGLTAEEALVRADGLMYLAKSQKNTVITDRMAQASQSLPGIQLTKKQPHQQILIADDSEMNCALLQEMLQDDFDILEASNGRECLAQLQEFSSSISIVLLDIFMPEMDGFEVLAEMSRLGYLDDIPVVMISSSDSDASIRQAYDMGASDYISRPFDARIIIRRIYNLIALTAKQRRLTAMVSQQIQEKTRQQQLMVDFLSNIIGYRSGESNHHFANISKITALLLQALREKTDRYPLTDEECSRIVSAAAFHDVGKIGIDQCILHKPGKLTPEEFEIMKTHTLIGDELIKNMDIYQDEPLLQLSAQICRWHHERYDGKGYPDGLKGEEIPIWAQVVSVADVYDALVSPRVYKPAFSSEKALEMIFNGECGTFNPILLDCLRQLCSQGKLDEGTPPPKN